MNYLIQHLPRSGGPKQPKSNILMSKETGFPRYLPNTGHHISYCLLDILSSLKIFWAEILLFKIMNRSLIRCATKLWPALLLLIHPVVMICPNNLNIDINPNSWEDAGPCYSWVPVMQKRLGLVYLSLLTLLIFLKENLFCCFTMIWVYCLWILKNLLALN